MNKQKIINSIIYVLIAIGVVTIVIVGIKLIKVNKQIKELNAEIAEETPVETPIMDIGDVEESEETEAEEEAPAFISNILSSSEVVTFLDENSHYFDTTPVYKNDMYDMRHITFEYPNTDVCFDVEVDGEGIITHIGNLYNALGYLPIVNTSGDFPEDEEVRKSIYETMVNNGYTGIGTLYYVDGSETFTIYMEGHNPTTLTIGVNDEWTN